MDKAGQGGYGTVGDFTVGGRAINVIKYADDLVLLAKK